jgi:ATP-binding cassette, subfamily B, multidrug efflux pump
MLKLIKYLKPFYWLIILVFGLLLGQALCDLALPDYMSRIVNVGIQQNGIESSVPDVLRSSEMNKVLLFVNQADQITLTQNYQVLDRQTLSDQEYQQYLKLYPLLATEKLNILKSVDSTLKQQIDSILGRPILIVYSIEKGGLSALPGASQTFPAGADPFSVLSQLPQSQLEALQQAAAQKTAALSATVIKQTAISYLSNEYRTIGVDLGTKQRSYIMKIGGLMLLLTLLGTLASIVVGFISARIAAGFSRNTRRQLFDRVEHFSNGEFDKFSTASLITRTTNDIQQIQMVLVILLRIVFYAPIIGVGGIIKALGEDASMSWIIGAAVLTLLSMIIIIFAIAISRFRKIQILIDRLNLVTREMLTGLMVIKAFNTQAYEEKKFDSANTDVTRISLFIMRIMVFMMPAMMLIMNGAILMVIWFGAHQVDQGSMQVGNMMAFMQYTVQIIMAFLMVSMIFIMVPRASVSAQRISEVIETKPGIIDPPQPKKFTNDVRGLIEFKKVCFKYPGAEDYVLQDISFTASPGHTTAICGGTGSGKSTLINLIPRFYDVTEGSILFDNLDVREVLQHDLRDRIGYVPQQTVLFSGTIESNLKYARENATQEELETAAGIAQSLDFIQASEAGFKTAVAQGGSNFSGGQKQRLSIARALTKRPELYIFDDSFSAIDFKTDAALRQALKKGTQNASVLIVGQRIGTIMNADKIIVLDEGKMVGQGTHSELMKTCKVYQELALSQLSIEELKQ